jgi:hypothetical protein
MKSNTFCNVEIKQKEKKHTIKYIGFTGSKVMSLPVVELFGWHKLQINLRFKKFVKVPLGVQIVKTLTVF